MCQNAKLRTLANKREAMNALLFRALISPLPILWVVCSPVSAATVSIDPVNLVTGYISLAEWNSNGNFESWAVNQVSGQTVSGGTLSGSVLDASNDPQLLRQNFSSLAINLASGLYNVVEVRIRRTGTASRLDLFWGTNAANGFAGTRRVDDQNLLPSDGNFHIIQFDMSGEVDWTSTLDDLRLDPFSSTATGGRSFEVDYVRIGQVIPEPSAFLLIGLSAIGLSLRRRC